jgi:CRP/FNR family transcriptional regulator
MSKISYRKKETIIKQYSHSTHVLYLKSGLVKIFTERRNEKNIILNIVTPGSFIGITNLNNEVNNFSAIALRESEICILDKETFLSIMSKSISFNNHIFELNSKLTAYLIDKISSLGTKQMHGRLADVILYLCNPEYEEHSIFESITRKDIAEMSGMSSESAIRLLTEFKNDGLIKTNGKQVEINNFELMLRLSEIG